MKILSILWLLFIALSSPLHAKEDLDSKEVESILRDALDEIETMNEAVKSVKIRKIKYKRFKKLKTAYRKYNRKIEELFLKLGYEQKRLSAEEVSIENLKERKKFKLKIRSFRALDKGFWGFYGIRAGIHVGESLAKRKPTAGAVPGAIVGFFFGTMAQGVGLALSVPFRLQLWENMGEYRGYIKKQAWKKFIKESRQVLYSIAEEYQVDLSV